MGRQELRPPVHAKPQPASATLTEQAAEAAKDLKEQGDDEDLVELQRKVG